MHPCLSQNFKRRFQVSLVALGLPAAVTLFANVANAARVEKVKDKQVLIDNESTDIHEGEKYFVMIDGKKKGVVKITKVKNGKSLGVLTKGQAQVDSPVEIAGHASKGSGDIGSDEDILKKRKKKKGKKGSGDGEDSTSPTIVGVLAGYAMDSQSASVADAAGNVTKVSFSGGGYSLKAFGDIPLTESIGAIARGGIEQVNLANGSNNSAIMYLTADFLVRYSFGSGGFVPFGAAGMGIHFPISKSSTYLDVPRISSTTVFFFDLGFNMKMGESTYFVGVLEYGMFPPSNDVNTSFITGRFGLGWRW